MIEHLGLVFGGRLHWNSFLTSNYISYYIPPETFPINGYYYYSNDFEEFLYYKLKRFLRNNDFGMYFQPLDKSTTQTAIEMNLLTNKEVKFCISKIDEYYQYVHAFNKTSDLCLRTIKKLESTIQTNSLFSYKQHDVPILELPVRRPMGGVSAIMDFYSLSIDKLLELCPHLVEYLILCTSHFCLDGLDESYVFQKCPYHKFMDITFSINDLKLEKVSNFNIDCKRFEIHRITEKIRVLKQRIETVHSNCKYDDYNRPIGWQNKNEIEHCEYRISQYEIILKNYLILPLH